MKEKTFFVLCIFLLSSYFLKFNYVLASNSGRDVLSYETEVGIENFLTEIKKYSNEYFPELSNEEFLKNFMQGNVEENDFNLFTKLFNTVLGEFQNNISFILKIMGIVVLCTILKSLQSNFSESAVSEIAFYVCYLMIVTLLVTSFTNIVSICVATVDKLSSFMNMVVPLLFALMTVTGNLTTISFIQPVILGVITVITYIINNFVIPIIYIATAINIVTNISSYVKLDRLSELLKKSALWIVEVALFIFVGILSIEGTLAASVDGMTSKIAKNIVSSAIPVVGKVLGDTVDSVIGSISITKNAIGTLGIFAILAITISPLIKSLLTWFVFNLTTAFIEPIADSKILKCVNGVSSSLKIMVGILAVVIFIFIIAITMMIKISNTALMYHS